MGDEGTLAIMHIESPTGGLIFRYRIFVRRKGGDFVQWGNDGYVCSPNDDVDSAAFGPDVPDGGSASPQGIFGLSHDELLKSEWVENDTLSVRFELEVRLPIKLEDIDDIPKASRVEVPSTTMPTELLALLDSGRSSDVVIQVEGETIHAHSQILSSRSAVFEKLLNGGMRESVSKEIRIDDCSALIFKAVLRFLYTDDFSCMEEATPKESSSSPAVCRAAWLQHVLAVSHKYALARLQAWCEQKLCESITVDEACPILCQAHLYGATQLMNACLSFIREHYAAVVVTEKFGSLAKEWPEVMLKINICVAGVSEASAKPAIAASQRASGKRKLGE